MSRFNTVGDIPDLKTVEITFAVMMEEADFIRLYPSADNMATWCHFLLRGMKLMHTPMALVSHLDYNPANPWRFDPMATQKYMAEVRHAEQSS